MSGECGLPTVTDILALDKRGLDPREQLQVFALTPRTHDRRPQRRMPAGDHVPSSRRSEPCRHRRQAGRLAYLQSGADRYVAPPTWYNLGQHVEVWASTPSGAGFTDDAPPKRKTPQAMIISASRRDRHSRILRQWFMKLAGGVCPGPESLQSEADQRDRPQPGRRRSHVFWTKNPARCSGNPRPLGAYNHI